MPSAGGGGVEASLMEERSVPCPCPPWEGATCQMQTMLLANDQQAFWLQVTKCRPVLFPFLVTVANYSQKQMKRKVYSGFSYQAISVHQAGGKRSAHGSRVCNRVFSRLDESEGRESLGWNQRCPSGLLPKAWLLAPKDSTDSTNMGLTIQRWVYWGQITCQPWQCHEVNLLASPAQRPGNFLECWDM